MINDAPRGYRTVFIALLIAIFASTLIFGFMMISDTSLSGDKAFAYGAVFVVVFISLNLLLLIVAYLASKKAKRMMKECVKCSASMRKSDRTCGRCGALQPSELDDSVYLDPKEELQQKNDRKK